MNPIPEPSLTFLKLGGSLITDKGRPYTPRLDVLQRLAEEIQAARAALPGLSLVLGHGAGSFGHVPAKKYNTRQGVHTAEEWLGFAEVWKEANALNRLVMDALLQAGLPAVSLPPSAGITAEDGQVAEWNLYPLSTALEKGLLPVVFGDVIFDRRRGGTILSTEDLFSHLARRLRPRRILLAGIEAGVWADFPACTRLLPLITPQTFQEAANGLHGSNATDVTGGMASKVRQSLELVQEIPQLEIDIFSAEPRGALFEALLGRQSGTRILAKG